MINGKLTVDDVMPYGPYAGKSVKVILITDPEELTAYSPHDGKPKYHLHPNLLKAAHQRAQDHVGFEEINRLWHESK